jgi:hypothetical protein
MKRFAALLILGVLVAAAGAAEAQVVYTTRPWNNDGGPCLGANGANMAGVGLQVPAGQNYGLNRVTIKIDEVVAGAQAILYLYAGTPAGWTTQIAEIGRVNVGGTEDYGEYNFVPSAPITLAAGQVYWYVLTSSDASGCAMGFSSQYGAGSATGVFTLVGENHLFGGSTNVRTGEHWMIEVNATVGGAQMIPTVGEAGLAAFIVLLAGAALLVLARRGAAPTAAG